MARLRPDPADPATLVWRSSSGRAIFSWFVAGFLWLLVAGMAAFLFWTWSMEVDVGLQLILTVVLVPLGIYCGALALLCWRNAGGFWGGRIAIGPDELRLKLPASRSLIHPSPAFAGAFRWAAIDHVESRLEAYRAQLMAMLQRPYWLVLSDGDRVLLFEDRGVGTGFATGSLEPVAQEIAKHTGKPMIDLPMAEGRGGLFGAWFTQPPPADAAPVSPQLAQRLWRRAVFTGGIGAAGAGIVIAARMLGG